MSWQAAVGATLALANCEQPSTARPDPAQELNAGGTTGDTVRGPVAPPPPPGPPRDSTIAPPTDTTRTDSTRHSGRQF
ncbi:hypothetical protein [Hymenobacter metallilatus]|uniref:Uncharacterized protein n=1 Tax=Hymenobacter metallilatus TaxID=2493666 RepID=A0A428IZH9_9BACT|nr:hypothetical protein [Hymenobacter metallilatus]RSK24747.1 hypothetical protein EI290_19015 [Hymenobacter metallilatus]